MATEEEIAEAKEKILTYMMIDLQRMSPTDDVKNYMSALIDSAVTEIEREGSVLDLTDTDHAITVEMYAAYLYRLRETPDVKMPKMLRYRLDNLLFSQKMATDTES